MEIQNLVIGIIIFVFFIVGGVSLISMFQDKDSTMVDANTFSQFNNTFNQYEKTVELSNKISNKVTGIQPAQQIAVYYYIDVVGHFFLGVWSLLILIFSSLGFILGIITGLGMFGIPVWVPVLVISIISVAFIFAIIRAITKTQV